MSNMMDGMMGWPMIAAGFVSLLVVAVLLVGLMALAKYLWRPR